MVSRLNAAYTHGYHGVELFYEDLLDLARRLEHGADSDASAHVCPEMLIAAAKQISAMCKCRDLKIIALQPFKHYEGLLDRSEHVRRIEELKLWFELAHELDTDLVSIPSSFLPASQVSDDPDLIISDLREAADLAAAASPPIKLSYESLCWGTRADLWEDSWDIVQKVDRPNFGLCLDTFNIAGRIYADPANVGGKNVGNPDQVVAESMARLLNEVDVKRVFLVQVVDAQRLAQPLVPGHEFYVESQPCRMSWSRNCRLFYGEEEAGAYLPIQDISWAIFQGLGYNGWISFELFNQRLADRDPRVVDEMARRGMESWGKFVKDMQLNAAPQPFVCASDKVALSPAL